MFSDCGKKPAAITPASQVAVFLFAFEELGEKLTREGFRFEEGQRGGWRLRIVISRADWWSRVGSRLEMRAATNGGGWLHAACGWWPSEAAARRAVEAACAVAFADEREEAAKAAARQAAENEAYRLECAAERRIQEERAAEKAAAEAAFTAAWEGGKRAACAAAAEKLGGSLTSDYGLVLLLPSSSLYERFEKSIEGIAALEARLAAASRPVTAASLAGLFGGAAQVKKGR